MSEDTHSVRADLLTDEGEYRVRVEPSRAGGYMVSLWAPDAIVPDVTHVDTKEQAREWAKDHVAWLKFKEEPEEFTL